MSSSAEHEEPQRDPVEDMVFLYLEERDAGLVSSYDEFARRHSSTGAVVRDRILALERAGMIGGEAESTFPERLGNFRLIERLGGGGMGVVYVAEEISLGRRVALKVIRPEQIFFGHAKERFRREVESIAKLSHPGIVQIFSFAEDGGVPYFAMELVEGAALGNLLAQFAGRSPSSLSGADLARAVSAQCGIECVKAPLFEGTWVRSCLEIARQVAVALEHAHARGVVHRDVKPSNVMITPDGRARLLDFGLASRVGASRLTRTGTQLGSMPYMPPELVGGRMDEAGPRTDVYSLGATLFEALALNLPFQGDTAIRLAQQITAGEHESLRHWNPDVSIDAETVCSVAMELDPERRYTSAGALASDLASVLERRPISARRTSRWIRARRWVERNPAGAAAAMLGTLVLFGGPVGYGILQARAAEKERGLNADLRQANQTVLETNTNLETAQGELERKNADLASSLLREQSETARAEQNFQDAFRAIDEMLVTVGADELREIPRFGPVRKTLLERALEFYRRLKHDNPSNVAMQREMARAARSIGDVLDDLGRSDEALAEYIKAVDLARAVLAIDSESQSTRHMFASNLNQLARKQQQKGNLELALAAFNEASPFYEALVKEVPENTRLAHGLAGILINQGTIAVSTGKLEQAMPRYARAVEVARAAYARDPENPEIVCRLAMALNGLSNCERQAGMLDKARADLREGWTLASDYLAVQPDVRRVQTEFLALSLNYGQDLTTRDPVEAERVLLIGFEAGTRLVAQFPEDLDARRGLGGIASNLGCHQNSLSRWVEAEKSLVEAVRQCEILVKSDGTRIEFHYLLGLALSGRSASRLGLERIEEARADADRGVEIFVKVLEALPKHPTILAGGAVVLMYRADVESKSGDWRTARASTEEGLALGAHRDDVAFMAFETLWHIAQEAGKDPELAGDQRARTLDQLTERSLEQLDRAIQLGFDDRKRLETLADYEGLRGDPRFAGLVAKLAARSK
jgi:serine/threonine protein kinase